MSERIEVFLVSAKECIDMYGHQWVGKVFYFGIGFVTMRAASEKV